jgi:hypothetical protein
MIPVLLVLITNFMNRIDIIITQGKQQNGETNDKNRKKG